MATRKTGSRKGASRTGGRRATREEETPSRGRASERTRPGEKEETRAPRQARTSGDGQRARPGDGQGEPRRGRRARGKAEIGQAGAMPSGGAMTGGQSRGEIEREMKDTLGLVPDFYDAVPSSVVQHAWGAQRDFELAETALDMKTKELIGLAVASHIKCRYCIYFHMQAAKAHGASEEELREAAAMGGLTDMFSNMITGARIDFDQFQRDVDRVIEHMKEHAGESLEGARI